ncbi:hypothetical protein Tco_0695969 [Tanacetum coccineum]
MENTAHVPPTEEEESIFMEIPKPKAKKTVNVEIQDLNSPRPNLYPSKLPYPERMKVRENDKPQGAQPEPFLEDVSNTPYTRFGLKDALAKMPNTQTNVNSLLRRQRETRGNRHYNQLDRTSALADFGASINLLPHSIYKKLRLEALTPTRMTLPLAIGPLTHTMGISRAQVKTILNEIDAFLKLWKFSSNFEKVISFRKETLTFLDNLLSDDASYNLASKVISDHEQEQNESSITFSPRIIESLPVSPIPVEDSEPAQEEIDIFLVPDDLIPPGVENDDSEDEDNELPNLDHQDDPSIPRPPPEPPDVEKCFEPEAGQLNSRIESSL